MKPTKDEVKAMSVDEYMRHAMKYVTPCASCGRHGQAVTESIEGRGYSYCDDAADCKAHQK